MDTAAAAMTQGDYDAVITSCDAAAELFPERTEPFILRADAYAAISALSERYSDTYSEAQRNAIDSYAAVVRVEPGDLQTRQKLMRLYFTAGDLERTVEFFRSGALLRLSRSASRGSVC